MIQLVYKNLPKSLLKCKDKVSSITNDTILATFNKQRYLLQLTIPATFGLTALTHFLHKQPSQVNRTQ